MKEMIGQWRNKKNGKMYWIVHDPKTDDVDIKTMSKSTIRKTKSSSNRLSKLSTRGLK